MKVALPAALAQELHSACEKHGLGAIAGEIASHATECLALVAQDGEAPLGATRFGGDPDLPADVAWPATGEPDEDDTRFCNFLGQVNFAELPRLETGESLPTKGILYLFLRSLDSAFSPVVYEAIYHPGDATGLVRRPVPDWDRMADEYLGELRSVRVSARPAVSIAAHRKALRAAIDTQGIDAPLHFAHLVQALDRPRQIGQLLGFANAGDVRVDLYRKMVLTRMGKAELHYNDYWDSMQAYEAEIAFRRERREEQLVTMYEGMRPGVEWLLAHAAQVAEEAAQWRLFLRLDSNRETELMVLDADPLYVFARDQDLAAARFDDLPGQVTQG